MRKTVKGARGTFETSASREGDLGGSSPPPAGSALANAGAPAPPPGGVSWADDLQSGRQPTAKKADSAQPRAGELHAAISATEKALAETERSPPRPLQAGEGRIWAIFCSIDEDESGTLDRFEVAKMSKKLGFTLSDSELANAFDKMDGVEKSGSVGFEKFVQWWGQKMAERRRNARMMARELFEMVDEDDSGTLIKIEVKQLAKKLIQMVKGTIDLDPPLSFEADVRRLPPGHAAAAAIMPHSS